VDGQGNGDWGELILKAQRNDASKRESGRQGYIIGVTDEGLGSKKAFISSKGKKATRKSETKKDWAARSWGISKAVTGSQEPKIFGGAN